MRKLLRHGRNSKPSSGGGGGDEAFVTFWSKLIKPLENVQPLVSLGTIEAMKTEDFGYITLSGDFYNYDPIDIAIFGNFPEGTTIKFNTWGGDFRGVESIDGTPTNDYNLNKTITIGSNCEVLDEFGDSWEPKQYSPYLMDRVICNASNNVYITIVMEITLPGYGTSIGGLDMYFNNIH